MKIDSYSVGMASSHSSEKSYSREESLRSWSDGRQPGSEGQRVNLLELKNVVFELSEEAKAQLSFQGEQAGRVSSVEKPVEFELSHKDKMKIQLIEQMMESLTGKKFKFKVMDKFKLAEPEYKLDKSQQVSAGQPGRLGWGFEYSMRESYVEKEKMSFSSQGIVKTVDGREIAFSVQLNMSREFVVNNQIDIRAGDALVDPLVINFNGNASALTETKFSFDLDSDGSEDQISFVKPGSGFLALDLNDDGKINNGGELFGPSTGDGFNELAAYDSDGNGWIDENDQIYNKLRIWMKDNSGNDILLALGQVGVGAIYLGNINTSFDLKDGQNALMGQIKQSGIYLKEDGTVGTVQQLDLVV